MRAFKIIVNSSSFLCWLRLCILFLVLLRFSAWAAILEVQPGPFRSGKAFVSCTFDGVKESCFLDTGSAITVLANSGQFSAYSDLGGFRFKSASGVAEELERILIRTGIVDRVVFSNIKVARAKNEHEIDSALGIDLLARQSFAVNFRDSPALFLNPKPPRQLLSGLETNTHGLLSVPMGFGATRVRAIWDTGASITAVHEPFVQAHPDDFKATGDSMKGTDGFGHEILVHLFRARKISVGGRSFSNVKVVALDLSMLGKSVEFDPQAVIGFNLIRRTDWYFDPPRRIWSIR
jgi:hypothetical protein